MKQFYASLFLALFFVTSGHAQSNCNAGYESPTFANTQSVPANTIFTITVTASSAGTLTGISFYNTGMSTANIKCCVYDDAAGLPG
ncbi:MAG TPA: hypothetical protein VL651_09895, partial [Bacteroidia bacterium]|nr:hypothetical protein [Bacteroidia bacterium]